MKIINVISDNNLCMPNDNSIEFMFTTEKKSFLHSL